MSFVLPIPKIFHQKCLSGSALLKKKKERKSKLEGKQPTVSILEQLVK
jgi:hypothetical protein